MSLAITQLSVRAGEFRLSDVSLAITTGHCGVLMGRSGSGKTTLMEALCGLRKVETGGITLDDQRIDHLRPGERQIGLVPQDTVLFPHMTVREHLEFGPRLQKWQKEEINKRVESLAASLSIIELLDRRPRGLSGGEAKRVAIGRAIAGRPKLLCLDEALTGLDREAHEGMMVLLKDVIQRESLTTLHITHRQEEAEFLGDLNYELNDGQISLLTSFT
ncbi:MAG: ABC transporter ATP-binding protein [Akkermansiaceae bacterium]|nr:ABC transporter ATP-binding protein [Akkermansiaceae bacterium]